MLENVYWHALNCVPGIGPQKFKQLLNAFGSPEAVWHADPSQLGSLMDGQSKALGNLLLWRKKINVNFEFEKLLSEKINLVTIKDEKYPESLRYIYGAPPVLYYKGSLEFNDHNAIAIVGSRKATSYGQRISEKIAFDLGQNGIAIISGMARGIDSCAHRGALKASGRTIAVLGCGLDVIYPPENKKLMEEIILSGAVITEFPLGIQPEPQNFPRRNRIISGLALGVVVVEAAEKSGSLITADFALEQGKDVFAVPGPALSRYSRGTNHLIKQGAKLVENAQDILEEYGITISSEKITEQIKLTALESKIVNLLSWEPVSLDELITNSDLQPEILVSQLSMLEIKGIIKQMPGQRYIIVS